MSAIPVSIECTCSVDLRPMRAQGTGRDPGPTFSGRSPDVPPSLSAEHTILAARVFPTVPSCVVFSEFSPQFGAQTKCIASFLWTLMFACTFPKETKRLTPFINDRY